MNKHSRQTEILRKSLNALIMGSDAIQPALNQLSVLMDGSSIEDIQVEDIEISKNISLIAELMKRPLEKWTSDEKIEFKASLITVMDWLSVH